MKLFEKLIAEMKRQKISQGDIAKILGITQAAVAYKLSPDGDFKSEEIIKIQETFFPEVDLKTLFTKT